MRSFIFFCRKKVCELVRFMLPLKLSELGKLTYMKTEISFSQAIGIKTLSLELIFSENMQDGIYFF